MVLTIEDIRAVHLKLKREELELPDEYGTVFVRVLTLAEMNVIFSLSQSDKKTVNKKLIEISACNEDGSPLFLGEDKKLIDGLPWSVVQAIAEKAMKLSKIDKADGDDAGKD